MWKFYLIVLASLTTFWIMAETNFAQSGHSGEKTVKSVCVQCHRIEGKPMPRRTKQAPDLIWAGNKYQSQWLEQWLRTPEQRLYPVGYDFKPKRKQPHLALSAKDAKAVSRFLATLKDSRIQEGVMKSGTPTQIENGKRLYREHACQNCHLTPAKNRRGYTGGKSSTSFLKLGVRLNADWVYRFNLNPNDFVPDSGAYIPEPPLPDEDIYAITTYMMTFQ
jgi:cytochrome c5